MHSLDTIFAKFFLREILKIVCNDNLRVAVLCQCHDVAIVGIGEMNRRNEMLKTSDHTFQYMRIHQITRSFNSCACEVRTLFLQTPHPFFVNRIRPASPEYVKQGQTHQQIAKRSLKENAGIQDDTRFSNVSSQDPCPELRA